MEQKLENKLEELDRGQLEIIRRLDDMAETLRNTVVEIGGVPEKLGRDPNRQSLRSRVHMLETDRTAARVAASALDAAKELHQATAEKGFNRAEKLVGLVLTALIVASTFIAPLLIHH